MIRNKRVNSQSFKKLDKLEGFFEDYGSIEFAYVFGSTAMGKSHPLSDIDIAVYLEEGSDPSKLKLDLLGKLNDFLSTDEIDLVIMNRAPLSLLGRILSQRKLLFCKNDLLRHRFESLTLRKYFDFRIVEQKHLKRRFNLGG